MKTLDELRQEIDAADKDLLDAFERRLQAAKSIGELKRVEGKPVFDPEREQLKLDRIAALAGFESKPYAGRLYKEIMNIAKDLESRPIFGVLGKSLPHTYSPQIHSLITTDYAYTIIEREEDELDELWAQGRRGVYGGFNVTIPYKKTALQRCDELTECAKNIGAVNTVVFREDGTSLGANTDVYGFKYMLKSSGIDPAGKTALILGTGGASVAVEEALKKMGASDIRFVSRTGDINYENVYETCEEANLIVNTTPVGMYPEIMNSPLDIAKFQNLEAVADIIYNPSCTRLLYNARKAGLKTAGGLKMLVAQAFKASAFFRGARDDNDAEASVNEEDVERVTKLLENKMKNITIIGMPGSGKTWFARWLGTNLGMKVVDLDLVYAEEYGETCAETLRRDGEDVFRERESKIAREYLGRSGLIISCGGGIIVRKENHFPIKCNSLVIYNERPLEVLSLNNRPLSAGHGVEKLYEQRKDKYESLADIVIHVDKKDSREEYLNEALEKYYEATCS
ncbi:MAG: chorismate mutase [Clostridiales bacterium]|nr:chorismate mutase [Clostridiales bacterium]